MKTKILVVDDEPVVRDVCKAILHAHGFDSILAGNGMEGFDAYREKHHEICLILSDVSMPVMDGVEMIGKIFEMHPDANVILMSGYNFSDVVPVEVEKLCSLLKKPFTPRELIEAVKKCLKYDDEHHPVVV